MNLEVVEESSYTFSFERIESNATKELTSATLRILSAGGAVYQAAVAMTVSANIATKAINFATNPTGLAYAIGRDWQAEFSLTYADATTEKIVRFFDIVRYLFVNLVTDLLVIDENKFLEDGIQAQAGRASSGSTSTLVDVNRVEANDFWNGGKLIILPILDTGKVSEHKITAFVKSTGTITFTPVSEAVTTESYTIRKSYQTSITTAGDIVREDMLSQSKRAYLMVDSTQLNRLILYKFMERYFQQVRKAKDDEYDLQFQYYGAKYKELFQAIPLTYDLNEDGKIGADEIASTFAVLNLSR